MALLALAGFCVLLLLPFLNKAIHIDDPLFVWSAKRIVAHPFDFYGFEVNWTGKPQRVADFMMNPPLASYYLAGVGAVFGWHEVVLHAAFLLQAIAVCLGSYVLARDMNANGSVAALMTVTTPVFLISATSLMCDVLMVAFWLWSIIFLRRGLQQKSALQLFMGAVLCAAACLTKYYGLALIPLEAIYIILLRRKLSKELLFLLIPIFVVLLFNYATIKQYDVGIVANAFDYTSQKQRGLSVFLPRFIIGILFFGGCYFTCGLFAWRTWSWRFVCVCVPLFIVTSIVCFKMDIVEFERFSEIKSILMIHAALMGIVAIFLLCSVLSSLFKFRDADKMLLVLWILGTFIFSTFLNWTINGRTMLPAVPALAVFIALQMRERKIEPRLRSFFSPVVFSAVFSVFVTGGDMEFANASREAAQIITKRYADKNVYFQAHWGFQYYMELGGAVPMDLKKKSYRAGDIIVKPRGTGNNRWKLKMPRKKIDEFTLKHDWPVEVLDGHARAGFYSKTWGALPYVIGVRKDDSYHIYEIVSN